jgi:hypothetical protein
MNWQAEQHRDECLLQQAATEALKASGTRPLTEDEQMALAYAAGLANDFYKEIRK